jgi:hypothetical protein
LLYCYFERTLACKLAWLVVEVGQPASVGLRLMANDSPCKALHSLGVRNAAAECQHVGTSERAHRGGCEVAGGGNGHLKLDDRCDVKCLVLVCKASTWIKNGMVMAMMTHDHFHTLFGLCVD